jgi:PAS domain S-box-containing protein
VQSANHYGNASAEICIEVRAKSVLDRSGTPFLIIGINRDVTERKHIEHQLRRNEALLAEAQRVAQIASWEWDMRARQVIWTDQLYQLFGLSPGELAPSYRTFFTRLHPDDRSLYADVVRRSLADGQPFEMEFRITRADDGRERIIYSRGVFMRNPQGQPIRLIGTAQDITERKHIEDEIRRLNADLEHRVAERTADLERSNQDLQQFAYISSHDLQEPLRTVISYTQLLENRYGGQLDEDGRDFLKFIVEGAQRMSDLITDLLAYSRVSSIEQKRTQAVALGDVVESVIANLQVSIGKTNAAVTYQQLPAVMGDHMQLLQLFQNLIANALKYRSEAPPVIKMNATSAGSFHVIRVSDNGIGIDPMYHERIFGLFKRLHGRDVPGTGLGLAICRKVVERHGGRIWVESQPGQGATFLFTLPRA